MVQVQSRLGGFFNGRPAGDVVVQEVIKNARVGTELVLGPQEPVLVQLEYRERRLHRTQVPDLVLQEHLQLLQMTHVIGLEKRERLLLGRLEHDLTVAAAVAVLLADLDQAIVHRQNLNELVELEVLEAHGAEADADLELHVLPESAQALVELLFCLLV